MVADYAGPQGASSPPHVGRHRWLLLGTTTGVAALAGLVLTLPKVLPEAGGKIVDLELAGGWTAFSAMASPIGSGPIRWSLTVDYGYIVVYVAVLVSICAIGARMLYTGRMRWLMTTAASAAVLAGLFDVAENTFLLFGVPPGPLPATRPDVLFQVATAMAVTKFVALLPAALCAALVLLTLVSRTLSFVLGPPLTWLRRLLALGISNASSWIGGEVGRARRAVTHRWASVRRRLVEGGRRFRDAQIAKAAGMPEKGLFGRVRHLGSGFVRRFFAPQEEQLVSPADAPPTDDTPSPVLTARLGRHEDHAYAHPRERRRSRYIDVATPEPALDAPGLPTAWSGNYRVPAGQLPGDPASRVGVCLSGGGIRAGTFAMGAVQSLAAQGVLARTQLLASVSGGGYFASALQAIRATAADPRLLLRDDDDAVPLPIAESFAAGGQEEDFVRRHGEYIADGAAEWAVAIFVILRNSLLGLSMMYATIVLAAWPVAALYAKVSPWGGDLVPLGNAAPTFDPWMWISLGSVLVLAVLAWTVSGVVSFPRLRLVLSGASGLLVLLGLLVAAFVVGIPFLVHGVLVMAHGTTTVGGSAQKAASVTAGAALVATFTTVLNLVSPKSSSGTSKGNGPPVGSFWTKLRTSAGWLLTFLLTFLVLAGLIVLVLIAFAAVVSGAINELRGASASYKEPLIAGGFLMFCMLLFDQTRMSLHPFYRERLASAFYLRRTDSGRVEPITYGLRSTLSTFGRPLRPDGTLADAEHGGLRLLLCAAAHVSGQSLAPPGRRVVPFVFSSDYVGAPDLGYFTTQDLEAAVRGKAYEQDVTLLAAAAISGAAVASSMGSSSTPYDRLLAVSNARLGAWLPNPRYHSLMRLDPDKLPKLESERAPLPWIRRLQYYAFELAGIYPADDRFVYVTDGGHYENLGLVELLRRRCHVICCIDASGDHSLAAALGEAAALAYEELGVVLKIDGLDLSTMSAEDGTDPNQDLRDLHKRLSTLSVVKGRICYPGDSDDQMGWLVVGKAVLGQDISASPQAFPLATYAVKQPEFPGDTTADQWFDVGRFQGYGTLGRAVGELMALEVKSIPGF